MFSGVMIVADQDVEVEAERLLRALMHVECDPLAVENGICKRVARSRR